MPEPTRLRRLRARLDRLPAAWVVVLAGFLAQFGLAVGMLVVAVRGDDRVGVAVGAALVGVVLLAGLASLPAVALLVLGRLPRLAATLAVLVGVGILVVNEAHPTVWPFSLALVVAGVRAWAGAGLDAADLLALDPGRFERVDPDGTGDGEPASGDEAPGDGT